MKNNLRNDLSVIAKLIQKEEKVLDVGCGDGKLLDFLSKTKNVNCRGIELKQNGVNQCVKKGLSVIQGDANFDLSDYPSNTFSTVILSQTIQAMIYPDKVIHNLIRIGKRAIISFPNFGFWKVRKDFLFNGLMPKNKILPFEWFDTPNIHLCSCNDFINFCKNKKININNFILLNENGFEMKSNFLKNLLAYQVVFCISKKN
ncbi:MAG: methionine biosynthesis protein MetW [Rickettsiales bacterium]|nr:methionine biosynthesis protein MetW [Rickettsiales bacterium]